MARFNEMAGILLCCIIAASAVATTSVAAAGETYFAETVGSGDTVVTWTPQDVSAAPPTVTGPPTPAGGAGTCPENYSKNFYNTFNIRTTDAHVIVSKDGDAAQMKLDAVTAAVFGSKEVYYTGRFSAFLKLPCGNSSGTVFAFYTSSDGGLPFHDEIDIEILGNETDTGYTMQTNIFVDGEGRREMRHDLKWFNPCQDYHEYFIQWNSNITMIGVDDSILRVFYRNPAWPYFNKGQGLWVSYWDGSKWATQGGRIKIDFQKNGPFVAEINSFHKLQACEVPSESDISPCVGTPHCWDTQQSLTPAEQQELEEKNALYCTYDYCQDYTRFGSTGFPADCQK